MISITYVAADDEATAASKSNLPGGRRRRVRPGLDGPSTGR
ncbi:hypothetical protein [Mycolicibacterium obuense]|nr:hypothetical protein [Mycolicibacterium obuense]